ncbi:MAG: CPBP family intramembrane metalloprotease, partial [Lentisphaeraceae bacterium]|nr:CPBP family intramembrane metalloprotease [Lentisphaeraceae bacterium]
NAFLWIIISTIIIKILRLPKYDSKKIDEQWTFYIIGVLLLYTSMILFGYLAQEVGFTPKKQDVAKQVIQMSETSIFLVILGPALLIPIVEELLFRSLLYRSLKFSLSPLLAAIISASLFGFAHIEPDTIPQLIIIGLILSYVYEKSGSIIIPIALHATNNFVTIIILVYFPKLSGV